MYKSQLATQRTSTLPRQFANICTLDVNTRRPSRTTSSRLHNVHAGVVRYFDTHVISTGGSI